MKRFILAVVAVLLLPVAALAATINVTVTTDKTGYSPGEAVTTTAVAKYADGTLVSNVKSAKITIKNPSGTILVNGASMTKVGTGTYIYTYTLSGSAPSGTWTDSCTITDKSNSKGTGTATFSVGATSTGHAGLTWTGYGMCKDCHRTQAQAMYQAVHYQWKGSAAEITTGPSAQGKVAALDGSSALNAYCINILGNWGACGACHVGTGATPVATASPTDAQLSAIDCLICHNDQAAAPYSRTRNAATGLFEPTAGLNMNLVVQKANTKPSRTNCLGCHAKAGGGDAVKRGDLAIASGSTSDDLFDVHMATDRGNLSCQSCHTFSNHKVAGRGTDLRPEDSTTEVNCSSASCHPTKAGATGHTTTKVGSHIARVACQTCHINKYAKNANDTAATEATETYRTWEHAEWNAALNRYEPMPTKANDLKPAYGFWNGTSWGNNLMDAAVLDPKTNAYKISRPNGSVSDTSATNKLYPFKYKTASQPLDTTRNKLIALNTATFFATGNYNQAVLDGLANMGYSGDSWTTVTTDEYQVLNHQVPPATGNVLACAACHPNATATQMKLMTDLGYQLKAATSTVCVQCHSLKSSKGYLEIHSRHVDSKRYDCSWCHTFSRPERGLTMPR